MKTTTHPLDVSQIADQTHQATRDAYPGEPVTVLAVSYAQASSADPAWQYRVALGALVAGITVNATQLAALDNVPQGPGINPVDTFTDDDFQMDVRTGITSMDELPDLGAHAANLPDEWQALMTSSVLIYGTETGSTMTSTCTAPASLRWVDGPTVAAVQNLIGVDHIECWRNLSPYGWYRALVNTTLDPTPRHRGIPFVDWAPVGTPDETRDGIAELLRTTHPTRSAAAQAVIDHGLTAYQAAVAAP